MAGDSRGRSGRCKRDHARTKEKYQGHCFHAQQAAEKYLKSYLVSCGLRPAKTHDLVALINECEKQDPEFSLLVPLCKFLQPFSVQVRYPDELALNTSDARKAIKAADEIEAVVLRKVEARRK